MESMTRRIAAAHALLPPSWEAVVDEATATAPVNIALAKYWGKRDEDLHLPVTDSFSVAVGCGTTTTVRYGAHSDEIEFNGSLLPHISPFYLRIVRFLDLVRPSPEVRFSLRTVNTVPTAAGLASSSSGFAALTLALNDFFGWKLEPICLSCLARLGSGSACRSVYSGFVRWQKGCRPDGRDSYAFPFHGWWSDLRMAVVMVSSSEKPISSNEAMRRTVATSPLYELWPSRVDQDLANITCAIEKKDIVSLGRAAERNALTMHATMHTSFPPVCYWLEGTLAALKKVWRAREEGVNLFVTMDAGPNVKLLFLSEDTSVVGDLFPQAVHLPLVEPSVTGNAVAFTSPWCN
jgi:diphosphomevalonate decarboxylase